LFRFSLIRGLIPTHSISIVELFGPLHDVVVCVVGGVNVDSIQLTGSMTGSNDTLHALSFDGYEPLLNSSCMMILSVPAGATFVGEVTALFNDHKNLTNSSTGSGDSSRFVFLNIDIAQSIQSATNQTWQNGDKSTRWMSSSLTLLQRRWFFIEKAQSLPLMSFETCDVPASIEKMSNETQETDSQFLPRLTVFPYFPAATPNGTVPWAPGQMKMQNYCSWGSPAHVTADLAQLNEGASVPTCPSATVRFADASQPALDRFYFYVSVSPVSVNAHAIQALVEELKKTDADHANRTRVSFFLSLRWDELEIDSQAIAPLRINNDLLLSFEGPEGITWPANASAVSVYGAIRSTDHFMNSTRDRAFLPFMLQSGCFLRTHATAYNATLPVVTTDQANRRVNIQLSLFYAFNNPDTKVTPNFYGYVAVLLQDARFAWVHFKGATIPAEAFPGQLPVSQLSQVIIASLAGLVIILAVLAITFGVLLQKANKARSEYQAVASIE
jgi:hypothetical protein